MNDKPKIIAGLVIFVILMSFPVWFNRCSEKPVPEPVLAPEAKAKGYCVLPKEEMKKDHMQILDGWRNSVVRDAQRVYVNDSGKEFNMSLSNTCLECHSNKADFCDKCHVYASVNPYCWDCHLTPETNKNFWIN